MSETQEGLRHKLEGAEELNTVVRTMKTLAASNIGQYERAVASLQDYYRTVELGLAACLRHNGHPHALQTPQAKQRLCEVIVFGSDQGLVGQFNESLATYLTEQLRSMPGTKSLLVVGERMANQLLDAGLQPEKLFAAPTSVNALTPLLSELLLSSKAVGKQAGNELYVFHNRPNARGTYAPQMQRLLPLDSEWLQETRRIPWPTPLVPQVIGNAETLATLLREYVFVTLFKACAESLNSENAARMMAMQRAEKNIGELLEDVQHLYNRLRQNAIDEELFDVVSGFEALNGK